MDNIDLIALTVPEDVADTYVLAEGNAYWITDVMSISSLLSIGGACVAKVLWLATGEKMFLDAFRLLGTSGVSAAVSTAVAHNLDMAIDKWGIPWLNKRKAQRAEQENKRQAQQGQPTRRPKPGSTTRPTTRPTKRAPAQDAEENWDLTEHTAGYMERAVQRVLADTEARQLLAKEGAKTTGDAAQIISRILKAARKVGLI